MATEIDIASSNTQIPVVNKKRRLCTIIKTSVALLIIAAGLTPTIIRLTRKTNTTTESMMNTTVSFTTTTTVPTDATSLITKENNPTTISKTTTTSVSLTTLSSTTSTTTTTTVTTSTTKPFVLQIFQRTNEVVYPIWNTTLGRDSSPSSPGSKPGTYWPSQPSEAALDGNLSSEYCNYGFCNASGPLQDGCGIQTGFYITFKNKPFILVKFRIATSKNSGSRDPTQITIEGSNIEESDLVFGKSWIKIYNGASGLATKDPGRQKYGNNQTISNNSLSFTSYRILITSKRGREYCVAYSEFEMTGRFPD
ncbi:unnamed protein product [Adineta steineri]|uniref:Uncharacterized protein n=1 Tax=Adineta steineri TaxID=433720 RepID=A0A819ZF33_9BILA|nr:unnamed protein product [Adineta steineri]CAF1470603.1 unnamed protein product [Adineta steineri]CAF4085746.1 unnamed protein product [Adineta steineri]CAF4173372.1 unnamed protein product [Adineta steineri]